MSTQPDPERGRAAFQLGVDLAEGASTFLTAGAEAEWYDPTHGRVDRDIQEYVDRMDPKSIAQRVAIENTLQARRGNRLTPAGTTTVELLEDAAREAGWAAGALDVADIELERTVRPGLVAAYRWPTNAHLIADVAELYLDPGMRAVDVTYGLGKWWQIWRPLELVEHDLDPKKGDGVNFTALPEADNTYDLAALDPPEEVPDRPVDGAVHLRPRGHAGRQPEEVARADEPRRGVGQHPHEHVVVGRGPVEDPPGDRHGGVLRHREHRGLGDGAHHAHGPLRHVLGGGPLDVVLELVARGAHHRLAHRLRGLQRLPHHLRRARPPGGALLGVQDPPPQDVHVELPGARDGPCARERLLPAAERLERAADLPQGRRSRRRPRRLAAAP